MEVIHARNIEELKTIIEPQLSPADWNGEPADWVQWHALVATVPTPEPAASLQRMSAVDAANPTAPIDPARPVLVERGEGAFDLEAWKPAALAAAFGALPLRVNGSNNDGVPVTIPANVFLSYFELQQTTDAGGNVANADIFTIAVFDQQVFDLRTAVATTTAHAAHELYSPPAIPALGLAGCTRRLLERMPPSLRQDTRWLLLGPARSGTSLHTDPKNTSAWNTVCHGVKRWAIM